MIKVDLSGARSFFAKGGAPNYAGAAKAHRALMEGTGLGSEFTGWLKLAEKMQGELKALHAAASRIRGNSDALIVIGIGGSYLGARAAIELLSPIDEDAHKNVATQIFFVGNGLSPDALNDTLEKLGSRDFSVNVISKSGTTLEPALAFRVFKQILEKKYGFSGAKKRIVATTDARSGVLKRIADQEGYSQFAVPDDVGGRFSVLSPVGLLPMAVAGIDIDKLVQAAIQSMKDMGTQSPENPAWQYAATRQYFYEMGKTVEILGCYEPTFRYMAEWWKQLYGESEGKNGVGILPVSVEYTADLHSMGQFIQDGPARHLETVVSFKNNRTKFKVPFEVGDSDGLNYLAGREFGDVQRTVMDAVRQAHIAGGVPNIRVEASSRDETGLAELFTFFELACGISGYLLGVNPFDQPGVEAYKKAMFKLLGKP